MLDVVTIVTLLMPTEFIFPLYLLFLPLSKAALAYDHHPVIGFQNLSIWTVHFFFLKLS